MKREPTRVYIEQVPETGGRWWRVSGGSVVIERARDPEHEIARELLALDVTGRMQTYVGGNRSMNLSIESAAKQSISDGASTRLRLVTWRPFDHAADIVSRPSGTVTPLAAKRRKAAVVPDSVQSPLHRSTVQQQTIAVGLTRKSPGDEAGARN